MQGKNQALDLERIREQLARVSDPVAVLEGIFAFAPIGLQVYRADGYCLVTNRASIRVRGEEPVRGWWDRQRLEQVITNLLTNAMRYGEGKPIEVTVRNAEGRAVLSVRDHGPGIPVEDQKRIPTASRMAT